ncbi:MAG TPA: ribonuclease HIII [Ktedonobacteraceae bacterium]|jgi:ribonuclease HIII|nr:ribonuclease HIII [Ktedonobacteraceae bacterium]
MKGSTLQTNTEALRAFAQQNGWRILEEKEIQGGIQLLISDGTNKVPFVLYSTGKVLIQGKPSDLKETLLKWWYGEPLLAAQPAKNEVTSKASEIVSLASYIGTPRIGGDESGKGDYFGPLVVALVYVDLETEPRLNQLGVRDSKTLTDARMQNMAAEIQRICPHFVLPIEPERYNELLAKRNLNELLGWAYAWAVENLLQKVSPQLAIIDKFGDDNYIRKALREKGQALTIIQRTKAEEDAAVAAASILARARFVQSLDQLAQKVGMPLPKGASDPAIITTGRSLVKRYGRDILPKVAKEHFKTTQDILDGL